MRNDELLAKVAPVLVKLPYKVVFLGGATTHLCITDPSAPEPQHTDDVDVVVDVPNPVEFHTSLRDALRALGAREDTSENAPLCRWKLGAQSFDVMSPTDAALGFSSRWYPLAVETSRAVRLHDGTVIQTISPPVFVATKLEAYLDRGKGDCLASKDIEDLIAVFDGRPEIVEEFRTVPSELLEFAKTDLGRLRTDDNFRYAVEGYLHEAPTRSREVFARIEALLLL